MRESGSSVHWKLGSHLGGKIGESKLADRARMPRIPHLAAVRDMGVMLSGCTEATLGIGNEDTR